MAKFPLVPSMIETNMAYARDRIRREAVAAPKSTEGENTGLIRKALTALHHHQGKGMVAAVAASVAVLLVVVPE